MCQYISMQSFFFYEKHIFFLQSARWGECVTLQTLPPPTNKYILYRKILFYFYFSVLLFESMGWIIWIIAAVGDTPYCKLLGEASKIFYEYTIFLVKGGGGEGQGLYTYCNTNDHN